MMAMMRPLVAARGLLGRRAPACGLRMATTAAAPAAALGIDFGTESVRAVLVSVTGEELGAAVRPFEHGVITGHLPSPRRAPLQPHDAYQHATDWVSAAGSAVREVLAFSDTAASSVVGIGVDFTSCTLLPTSKDGTPLFLAPSGEWSERPHAWPKLWKHHGATAQADSCGR
jgi:L-ribulokinase